MSPRENEGNWGIKSTDEGPDSDYAQDWGRTSRRKQVNQPENQVVRGAAQVGARRIHKKGRKVETLHKNSTKIFIRTQDFRWENSIIYPPWVWRWIRCGSEVAS